jgi:hypothetical protein
MIEAIQHITDQTDAWPLRNEDTRQWLKNHGFDLARWLSWWDMPGEAGTKCRHFRQDETEPKPLPAIDASL